jgi:acyl carrier protein
MGLVHLAFATRLPLTSPSMSYDDIASAVRAHICDYSCFRSLISALRDEDSLVEKRLIDSFGVLSLVVSLESTFGITILDDEVTPDNLDSIARIASFVSRKIT